MVIFLDIIWADQFWVVSSADGVKIIACADFASSCCGGYLWMIGSRERRKSFFGTHETLRGEQLRKLNLSTKLSEKPNNMVGAISGSR